MKALICILSSRVDYVTGGYIKAYLECVSGPFIHFAEIVGPFDIILHQ